MDWRFFVPKRLRDSFSSTSGSHVCAIFGLACGLFFSFRRGRGSARASQHGRGSWLRCRAKAPTCWGSIVALRIQGFPGCAGGNLAGVVSGEELVLQVLRGCCRGGHDADPRRARRPARWSIRSPGLALTSRGGSLAAEASSTTRIAGHRDGGSLAVARSRPRSPDSEETGGGRVLV